MFHSLFFFFFLYLPSSPETFKSTKFLFLSVLFFLFFSLFYQTTKHSVRNRNL